MIEQITKNVLKFYFQNFGSNCYLINKKIMIDTSSRENRESLLKDFRKINFKPVGIKVLLTHLHVDHIGNLILFKNSKIYLSEKELENFKINPEATTLANRKIINELSKIKFIPLPKSNLKIPNLKIIETPGHTSGSLCFFLKKEKILFSGDTLFEDGFGRTDLQTSVPKEIFKSFKKLKKLKFKILCPGH